MYPPPCPQGTNGVSLRFVRSTGLLVCCPFPLRGLQGVGLHELVCTCVTVFHAFFGSVFQPPKIRLWSYLGANLWPKCSQNASQSLPKRSQKVSRGGLCPFVKLCVLLKCRLCFRGFRGSSNEQNSNKSAKRVRGALKTHFLPELLQKTMPLGLPWGPNGSPRHLQGEVDEVTFSCFLPSKPQVVPKMAPGEPQGCPEPPQVPTGCFCCVDFG